MFLCLISFPSVKAHRLLGITGKMEPFMVISAKKSSNFHSFSQLSYKRGYFISSSDSYLAKRQRSAYGFILFPRVGFSGLNTRGAIFCCRSVSLRMLGSPFLVSGFKACCGPWQRLC